MKNLLFFLVFIVYSTLIFFLPNNLFVFIFVGINLLNAIFLRVNFIKMIKNMAKILPFILFTFIFNYIFDGLTNALWLALKLLIVCNITFIYSTTISVGEFAKTIRKLFYPLEWFKVKTQNIEIMVAISLSMIPILKREYLQIKDACKAKNIKFNFKNMKIILSKVMLTAMKKVNTLEDSLIEKGFEN